MNATVDLLDCATEPTDEQLRVLMRDVGDEARAKAARSRLDLIRNLRAHVQAAQAHLETAPGRSPS